LEESVRVYQTEHELAVRVIDTLLREDYAGLSQRVHLRQGIPALHLPAGQGGAGLVLPLERDGFLADLRIRRAACPELTLDDVDSTLTAVSDPLDSAGVTSFADECRQALATLQLRERCLPGTRAGLARRWHASPGTWCGASGTLAYEALAAAMPHPVYPTSECRRGLSEDDSLHYMPEYRPEFGLRWAAIPRSRLTTAGWHGRRPPWWPVPAEAGLPESLAETHDLLPVHPVTARHQLARALDEAGLTGAGAGGQAGPADRAVIAPGACLRVIPTLSARTVSVVGQPGSHIKLPLPTSTLGQLNRRFIQPGTLADGALVWSVLATATRDDEMLDGLLLADEGTYAHAGHPYLACLLRRLPAGLEDCRIVPLGALLAPGPGAATAAGRPLVVEDLAGWAAAGDLPGLFGAYLEVLFNTHVRLFVRYGIALEAHQQNTALVLSQPAGAARAQASARLLVKDFDGALIHLPRLESALGPDAPAASAFADPRLITRSDNALADVFITIIVHLCAGALAFGLAERGVAPLPDLLALIRQRLATALDRQAGWPAAAVLRARVLDADRLPGKSMVTAGTLVAKSRTGASDINKFYGTNGPNYLKANADLRSCE
jgi:siderophore synthetase component